MQKKFIAYVASAGSGKTFALVKDYLKLILTCPRRSSFDQYYFQNILAITFTNNAASEMRKRIQKEISDIAEGKMTPMLEVIIKEIYDQNPKSLMPQNEIQQKAKVIKRAIGYRYSDFGVRTIDSFQQSIGVAFQRELYLPPQTEIKLSTKIKGEVLDEFLNRMGDANHKMLTKFTIELIYRNLDNQKSINLEGDIEKYIEQVYQEFPISLLAKTEAKKMRQWQTLQDRLYKYINYVHKKVHEQAKIAKEAMNKAGLCKDDFFQKERGIVGFFNKYIATAQFTFISPNDFVQKTIAQDKWSSGGASTQTQQNINTICELLKECFFTIEKMRQKEEARVSLVRQLLNYFYEMAVSSSIIQIVEKVKSKRRFADLLEIACKVNEVILKDPVPYVYEKVGERYNHVLIDEFQDTSQVQWSNLAPLVSNSLSKDFLCAVVGDTKQSIYQWRGTSIKNLAHLPSIAHMESPLLDAHQMIIEEQFQKNILDTNYRSAPEVIDFNNSLFSYLIDSVYSKFLLIKSCYESIAQKAYNQNLKGSVSILSLSKEAGIHYFAFIKQQIHYFLKEGFGKKDIAILCRNNHNISAISIFLSSEGIAWQSDESTHYLKDSAWIQSIICLLDLQKNYPTNHTLFPDCLLHFADCLDKEIKNSDLFAWLEELKAQDHNRQHLLLMLKEIFKTQFQLAIDFEYLQTLSVFALVKEICFVLQPHISTLETPYMEALQECVWNFCKKEGNDLSSFLDFWKSENPTAPQSTSRDAVHLITIHKAKGLEFPIVLLPLLKVGGRKNVDPIWKKWNKEWLAIDLDFAILKPQKNWLDSPFEKIYMDYLENQILENLNLLYVALTRAKQHLIVLADGTIKLNTLNNNALQARQDEIAKNYLNGFIFDFLNYKKSHFRYIKKAELNTHKGGKEEILEYQIFSTDTWDRDLPIENIKYVQKSTQQKVRIKQSPYLWQDPKFLHMNFWESSRARVFQEESRLGVAVHNILGYIDDVMDISKALHLGVENCWIEPSQRSFFEQLIKKVITQPSVRHAFEKSKEQICYKEHSLLGEDSCVLRPDRFVYHPARQKLTLIDYKTGVRKTKDQSQLKKYEKILKKVFPDVQSIDKYLIYISLESNSVDVVEV